MLIFAALSVVGVALGTVFFFVASVSGIFFASLIYWKQSGALFGLVHYHEMIALVTDSTIAIFAHLNLPPELIYVARILLELVRDLFNLLALFKIDLSGLNVTCEGSKAPLILLINLLVFGAVVILIQSRVALFRSLVLAPTLVTYTSFLLSSEYCHSYTARVNKKFETKSAYCLVRLWQLLWQYVKYASAILQVIPILIFSSLVDVKLVLRFAVAQVQFAPLVSSGGAAPYTEFCNKVPGLLGFDSALAYCTTLAVYLLLLPVLYEAARVVCPYPVTEEIRRNNLEQKTRAESRRLPKGGVSHANRLFKFFAHSVRYCLSYLAPDLHLAFFTKRLFHALKRSVDLSVDLELSPTPAPAATKPNSLEKQYGRADHEFQVTTNPMQPRISSAPESPVDEAFYSRASTSERDEKDNDDGLPTYWGLLHAEAAEIQEIFPALSSRTSPLVLSLAFCPVGHIFTTVGRDAIRDAGTRVVVFFMASFGFWGQWGARGYMLDEKVVGRRSVVEEFAKLDGDLKQEDKNKLNYCYSAALDAIMAPRAILLQLCPFVGGIWSQFTINTASSSILALNSSSLCGTEQQKIFPMILFVDALHRAKLEENRRYENKKWLNYLSAFRSIFKNSRSFQFVLQLYRTVLPILLLRNPTDLRVVASMVCILLPTAFVDALGISLTLGKLMNIKDPPMSSLSTYGTLSEYWDKYKSKIKELQKQGKVKEEIIGEFIAKADKNRQSNRISPSGSVYATPYPSLPRRSNMHRPSFIGFDTRDSIPAMDHGLSKDVHGACLPTFASARLPTALPPGAIHMSAKSKLVAPTRGRLSHLPETRPPRVGGSPPADLPHYSL